MEKKVWLEDGRKADVIEKLSDGRYLVAPYYQYYSIEDDECMYDGFPESNLEKLEIVNRIFKKPPIELIDEEYKQKSEKIKEFEKVLKKLKLELMEVERNLTNRKCELSKGIIDLSELRNANKRITVFLKNSYNPIDCKFNNSQHRMKLSISINVSSGQMDSWASKYYHDGDYWGNSEYIDEKYGFLIDKTDEEIIKIAKGRSKKIELENYRLEYAKDEYLTPELIEKKKEIIAKDNEQKIKNLKSEIEKRQTQLSELIDKL